MDIVIDLTPILDFVSLPPHIMVWRMFLLFGWMPIVATFLWGAGQMWLSHIHRQWGSTQKYILLAIDIPRGNAQSPKAVENMFSYLAGAHSPKNLIETYWIGQYQLSFSFEIVSIDGYIQFLVHTPESFRDIIESSIYAQYPDAEITEVNDYTEGAPSVFPDDSYDIWGTEFVSLKSSAYPIRTYEEFEHKMGEPETHYKDPMAPLMDLMSSLRPGEQMWYQIIVIPTGFEWPVIGDKEIAKILREKVDSPKNIADKIVDGIVAGIGNFSEAVYQLWGGIEDVKKEEKDESLKMMNLKPKEKKQVEAIQKKTSKVGYEIKIRFIYLAKKEVKNNLKVVNGFVGYMKQFSDLDLNNIRTDKSMTQTSSDYIMRSRIIKRKKEAIMRNYKNRDDWAGRKPFILNIEELATIWHFPVESVVKAPMIQKTPGKKVEAPMTLPVNEDMVDEELLEPIFETKKGEDKADNNLENNIDLTENNKEDETSEAPPSNLPFI